jgi:hypothetical protein
MKTAAERADVIERSLRCFTYGWCSFIPVIGVAMFVLAVLSFQKARILNSGEWNPAVRYLHWGMLLALVGGFVSILAFGLMIFGFLNSIK